jgi:hypothetical protein
MPIDTDLTIDAMVEAVEHLHDLGLSPVPYERVADELRWTGTCDALEAKLDQAVKAGRLRSRKGPTDFDPVYWVVHN